MNKYMRVAAAAALAMCMPLGAAYGQVEDCQQLSQDINNAQYYLSVAVNNRSSFDYDEEYNLLLDWYNVSYQNCELDGSFQTECQLETELAFQEAVEWLDGEEQRLEEEVDLYSSTLSDLQERWIEGGCY